jgi:hypothetical protein
MCNVIAFVSFELGQYVLHVYFLQQLYDRNAIINAVII